MVAGTAELGVSARPYGSHKVRGCTRTKWLWLGWLKLLQGSSQDISEDGPCSICPCMFQDCGLLHGQRLPGGLSGAVFVMRFNIIS